MTKLNELLFLNSNAPIQIRRISKGNGLAQITRNGRIDVPSALSDTHVSPEGKHYPGMTLQQFSQTDADALAKKRPAYSKEQAHIGTQRFRIVRMIVGRNKKEFTAIVRAFEVLAQTPTGRQTLLTIPESTSYAVSKLPSMAQMCGNKRQIIFSDDKSLYKKPLAETVDTVGHEYTHLINHRNIYGENFEETEADFFTIKILDEITARMQASQMVHEARETELLPCKSDSRPLTVSQAFDETLSYGYPDIFISAICEKRHISPFLLAQSEPVHSDYFRQKAIPYFLSAYPALKEESLLKNIESLYKKSIAKRTEELISMGCKIPPAMVAAFGRKGR